MCGLLIHFLTCVIWGFRRSVNEICALLGFYAAQSGSVYRTLRDNLSAPFKKYALGPWRRGRLKKVECTSTPPMGCTAHRGSRGIALPFLDHGTRRGWGVSVTPRPLFTPGKNWYHCTGGWVGPRVGLDRCENLAPTGFRSPDRPDRSQSLYRLRYPAHKGPIVFSETSLINYHNTLREVPGEWISKLKLRVYWSVVCFDTCSPVLVLLFVCFLLFARN